MAGARADAVADFYRGKTINLLIGINVGGSYDIQARLIARYIGAHIPGNPTIVPQNMVGAGGLTMANYLASVAPRDGTAMGMMANTLISFQAVKAPGVRFDVARMPWIGSIDSPPNILVVRAGAGVTSAADLVSRDLSVAASAKGAITYIIPSMLNEYAGARFRIVVGYQGSANMNLALDRGEVDAIVNSWPALKVSKPDWFAEGKARIIAHGGSRRADLAGLPTLQSLASREEDRKVMDLVLAGDRLGHPMAMPPDTPSVRVEALRAAFEAVTRDPAFRDEAMRAGYELEPTSGAELQAMIATILKAPEPIAKRALPIISP